ncbi:MAG: FecR domain-containing protein [Elusimicrobia bacterium]|nr:FecR domain-containing protein [Elusimicrobiota bacterium]
MKTLAALPHSSRLLAALALALLPVRAWSVVSLGEASGNVQIRKAGAGSWGGISGPGHVVQAGDEIKTGRGSRAVLVFDDGSKVEIGPNGSFTLEQAEDNSASMRFNLGFMKAWVSKALSRRFQVRTPTAVASVRGTEFDVAVADNGNTNISVFQGLVGVADGQGNEVLLAEGQRVDVTAGGIQQKQDGSGSGGEGSDGTRQALKREVGLEMTKEEVQAAAAVEQKSSIYQQGKALIDVNGNRVRVEEYIIRPTPSQFKLVVLNERADRFDYFYYLGTFNRDMPADISVALRQIQGQAITQPDYFLTAFETGRSNTTDSVLEQASGGHLVDINNNADAPSAGAGCIAAGTCDDVQYVFDPAVDGVVRLNVPSPGTGAGNDSYWTTLYQKYDLYFNKVPHVGWNPSGSAPAYNPVTFTGGVRHYGSDVTHIADETLLVRQPDCIDGDHCTLEPQPGKLHFLIYAENTTGTKWSRFENFIISDEGRVGDASAIPSSPRADFKRALLDWNYQQIITSSEFNGRKIDLVVAPRILIESGLIR